MSNQIECSSIYGSWYTPSGVYEKFLLTQEPFLWEGTYWIECVFIGGEYDRFPLKVSQTPFLWKGMSLKVKKFKLYLERKYKYLEHGWDPDEIDAYLREDPVFSAQAVIFDEISGKTAYIDMSEEGGAHLRFEYIEAQKRGEKEIIQISVDDDDAELLEIVEGLNLIKLLKQAIKMSEYCDYGRAEMLFSKNNCL